jgi:beta-glucosidase
VNDLIDRMTLKEKIGQLLQYPVCYYNKEENKFSKMAARKLIQDKNLGSLLNSRLRNSSPGEWADITNEIQLIALKDTRLGIPIIIGDDIQHGYADLRGTTIFPVRLGQAATWNDELVKNTAEVAAMEARGIGTHWAFAPMLSVVRDPRWGRVEESFGEDPYLIS